MIELVAFYNEYVVFRSKKTRCGQCKGKGSLPVRRSNGFLVTTISYSHLLDNGIPVYLTCPKCKGAGVISNAQNYENDYKKIAAALELEKRRSNKLLSQIGWNRNLNLNDPRFK